MGKKFAVTAFKSKLRTREFKDNNKKRKKFGLGLAGSEFKEPSLYLGQQGMDPRPSSGDEKKVRGPEDHLFKAHVHLGSFTHLVPISTYYILYENLQQA